jgi:hypothetical protein
MALERAARGTTPRLLPVWVPAEEVERTRQPPAVGRGSAWQLLFIEQPDASAVDARGLVRLDAVAIPLEGAGAPGRNPTRLVAGDVTLHWDPPVAIEGPVQVNGYVQAAAPGAVPETTPVTEGVVLDVQIEERRFVERAGDADPVPVTRIPPRYHRTQESPTRFGPLEVDRGARLVETGVLVVVQLLPDGAEDG